MEAGTRLAKVHAGRHSVRPPTFSFVFDLPYGALTMDLSTTQSLLPTELKHQKYVSTRAVFNPLLTDGYSTILNIYTVDALQEIASKYINAQHCTAVTNIAEGPDIASCITTAARLAQESLSLGIDTNSSFARSDVPAIHQLLKKCLVVVPHLAPLDSSLLSRHLAHPDMSGSNMLIESPEKPSIKCFLDWQSAIVAPIFMQASIPALLAYTDGVFNLLDSEGSVPLLPKDLDQLLSDEQEYLRLHHKLLSRYRFYLILVKLVPIHVATWRYSHQEVMSDLPLYLLRCWADGPLKLRNTLITIPGSGQGSVPFLVPSIFRRLSS
ncbi:uncharacterized protein ARMOST_02967 [Armillaria ostoyae]|uniref:Aminoglycoside phosphotransferase domain-containing protein n=1 Tax=Armillaria ostoyae TaxID=47428 RepID=A0A284QT97_ARMOS|nr:uncharacterized protein ARMOST_02967 [Armillaria ostoyae]